MADLLCEYMVLDAAGRSIGVFTQGSHATPFTLVLEPCKHALTVGHRGCAAQRFTRLSLPHTLRPLLDMQTRIARECARLLWETAAAAADAAADAAALPAPASIDGSAATAGSASWALELCERLLDPGERSDAPLSWRGDSQALAEAFLRCWETGSDPVVDRAHAFSLRPPPPSAMRFAQPTLALSAAAQRHPALAPVLVLTPAFLAMHCDPVPAREAVGFCWRLRADAAAVGGGGGSSSLHLFPFALAPSGRVTWLRCAAGAGEAPDVRAERIASLLTCTGALPLLHAAAASSPRSLLDAMRIADDDEALGPGLHACAWESLSGSLGGGGLRSAARTAARLLARGEAAAQLVALAAQGAGAKVRVLPLSWALADPSECQDTTLCSSVAAGSTASQLFLP